MALYAQPWASAAPGADQAEGPKPGDIAELCAEFEYHIDSDDYHSIGILRDMITAAITRWRAPAAEPAAQPVDLATPAPEDPKVGHVLRLAEIIRGVDGKHDLGAAALAEAILKHPSFSGCHDGPAALPAPVWSGPKIIHDSLGRKLENVLYCDPQTGEVISYVMLDNKGRQRGDRHEILPFMMGELLKQREFYPAPLTIQIESATNDHA